MNKQELEAMEARCNAATPGPWGWRNPDELRRENQQSDGPPWGDLVLGLRGNEDGDLEIDAKSEDAEFIANARTDMPALIAAYREQQKEIERLNERLRDMEKLAVKILQEVEG